MWRFGLILIFISSLLTAAEIEKTLLIITSDTIAEKSAKLDVFVAEKEKRGFSVTVATEKTFGGAGVKGQEKALIIREWLKTQRNNYHYLLLIGDPNPKFGDIPMVGAYTQGPDGGDFARFNYLYIATDQIYRDIDSTGDCNGNGYYYEFAGDEGYTCVNFTDTFITGRIPVYFGDTDELDAILDTTVRYMNQSELAAVYRKKMLFPMSFVWFDGYNNLGNIKKENRETADVSEWLIRNILTDRNGYSWTRLYEKEGHFSTKYETDAPLTAENMNRYWKEGYGVIFWGGHGQPTGVVRTIWQEDVNGDNLAQNSEVTQKDLVKVGDFKSFDGAKPGFVIALSCLVGDVVPAGNLSHDMLKNGAAVGVISSTFLDSPSYTSTFEDFDSALSDKDYTLDLIGIHVIDGMTQGKPPAQMLATLRSTIGTSEDGRVFDHKLMMHYYGDPSLTLQEQAVAETPDTAGTDDSEPASDADAAGTDEQSSGGCSLLLV